MNTWDGPSPQQFHHRSCADAPPPLGAAGRGSSCSAVIWSSARRRTEPPVADGAQRFHRATGAAEAGRVPGPPPLNAGGNRSVTTGLPEYLVTRLPGLPGLPSLPSLPSLPREMVHRPTGYLVPAVAGRTDLLRTWIQGGYRRDHRPPSRAGAHGAPPAVAGHPVQARGPAEVPPGPAAAVRAFSVRALPSGAPLQAQGAHTASSPGGAWRMARYRCRCASPVLGAGPDITGPAPEIRRRTSRMSKFGRHRWTSKSPHRPGTVRAP